MTVVRGEGRLRAFLALIGILVDVVPHRWLRSCNADNCVWRSARPAGAGVAAHGEILSQGNDFQRSFQVASDGNYLLQDLPFGVIG